MYSIDNSEKCSAMGVVCQDFSLIVLKKKTIVKLYISAQFRNRWMYSTKIWQGGILLNKYIQWRIQNFPDGRVSTSEFGAKTYCLARFLPKTAWKWKQLDQEGAASLAPPWIGQCFHHLFEKSLPRELRFHPSEASFETILLSFSKGFVNLPVIG